MDIFGLVVSVLVVVFPLFVMYSIRTKGPLSVLLKNFKCSKKLKEPKWCGVCLKYRDEKELLWINTARIDIRNEGIYIDHILPIRFIISTVFIPWDFIKFHDAKNLALNYDYEIIIETTPALVLYIPVKTNERMDKVINEKGKQG